MKEKVIKYLIFILLIPIMFIIILSITNSKKDLNYDIGIKDSTRNDEVGNLYIPSHNNNSYEYQIKTSNSYAYLSVIGLVLIFGATYVFFVRKSD